ncbi:threonine ammonia-lyase [Flavilitoribacter nigricans]|uniref:Serine dehydratase n=1 Tax=Flavilitoribacter nigricans (strain ATCC 23147 / DSM 23189 / NBRC 102662 / NCIMB 1420 / SS-2) TaxID=1122177 RepID=A0A2D0NFZ3_FLAN2|nr:pyridoxal-phosphate dependent enzyme [Flavilitoribacter nigricans]PHN07405.1 serine dehydratase [Flavilitoribacter nigricans DSM 23189 = NBRC 102662]
MSPKLPVLQQVPSRADIEATHLAIADLIHRTPVMTCDSLDQISGAKLFFKCENFQKVGAFKMRGAASAALRLTKAELEKGIATHSSGNHAQAVARAAQYLGVPAYIVMPENAPASKRAATLGYGAEVISCAPTIEARQETLDQVVARTGATFIHPYDDYHVIAGQATAAKELIEDAPALDIIMAPVGGGGLMSGTALSSSYFSPDSHIMGAEPEIVNDAARAFESGRVETNTRIDTIADGLRTNLSEKTLTIIREHVERINTVEEAMIIRAMRLIWERMKIVIEPSCAVPFAAVLTYPEVFAGQRVGMILTGGNVDLEKLPF